MDSPQNRLGLSGKRLVAYGAGRAFYHMQTVAPLPLEYVVDDTPGFAGRDIMGLRIYPSSQLMGDRDGNLMVIIYANLPRSVLRISQSLNSMGFVSGKDYIDWSLLQYESMKPRMETALGIHSSQESFRRVRLLSLYASIQNLSTIAGTWLFVELLENLQCDAAIAECGVYNGGNAFISLLCSPSANKRPYHLLDSFEGFPELSQYDPSSRKLDFKDVSLAYVRDVFSNFQNVQIHKGYFSETLPALSQEKFALVYVDCDLYEPTLELCEFFYPRLTDGGCLLFHDYWVPESNSPHLPPDLYPFRGVNKAVNEFLGSDIERLVVFPETTHAVLIK